MAAQKMIEVTRCPACQSEAYELWCEIQDRPPAALRRCKECDAVYLNRIMTPAEMLEAYGPDYYLVPHQEGSAESNGSVKRFGGPVECVVGFFRRGRARFVHRLAPPGPVLDVGCGRGLMLATLKNVWARPVVGIQLSSEIARLIRTRHRIEIHESPITECAFPEGYFSGVTLWHVLEHIANPQETLRAIYRVLRPEGRLIIEVPNPKNPLIDERRDRWFEIDFPNHCVFYSPLALENLLARVGFVVEESRHFNLEFSVFCVLQTMLNRICRERDVLYDLLRKKKTTYLGNPLSAWLKVKHLALAMLFVGPALAVSLIWAARREGEILRVVCKKRPDSGAGD